MRPFILTLLYLLCIVLALPVYAQDHWSIRTSEVTTRLGETDTVICAVVVPTSDWSLYARIQLSIQYDYEGEFKVIDTLVEIELNRHPDGVFPFRVQFNPKSRRAERWAWIIATGGGREGTSPLIAKDAPPLPGALLETDFSTVNLAYPSDSVHFTSKRLTLRNSRFASDTLRGRIGQLASPLSIDSLKSDSINLAPGDSLAFWIRLDTATPKTYKQNLIFTTNAVYPAAVVSVPIVGEILRAATIKPVSEDVELFYPSSLGLDTGLINLEAGPSGNPVWIQLGPVEPPFYYVRPQDTVGTTYLILNNYICRIPITFRPSQPGYYEQIVYFKTNAQARSVPVGVTLDGHASAGLVNSSNTISLSLNVDGASNMLSVNADPNSTGDDLMIFDLLGRRLLQRHLSNQEIHISVAGWPRGTYIAKAGDSTRLFMIAR